jgi:signal transduction histidine kinase
MHAPSNVMLVPTTARSPETAEHRSYSRGFSSVGLLTICVLLVSFLAYLDYLTGYEQSLLLFYLVPIALATWFSGLIWGLVFSFVSVFAWVGSDVFAGIPNVRLWNVAMAVIAYALFAILLSKLRSVLGDLENRVRERTKALRREIAERERLDREIAEVADRERRRLGQDLHDSLCQHLTGTALTAQTLRERLAARSAPEIAEADKVVRYIEEGIDLSRNLARGFFSPELEAEGLVFALQSLAETTTERFQISCEFESEGIVRVPDSAVATQLYRIAQEAVMNAIKHANPQRIDIRLKKSAASLTLSVTDDGIGLPEKLPKLEGLGMRLMSHGAALMNAEFDARRNPQGGTVVSCRVNINEPDSTSYE